MSVSLERLASAGCHFGHIKSSRNPEMNRFVWGERNKLQIIDLVQTQEMFNIALKFIAQLVLRRGKIVFVGTKRAASDIVKEQAQRCSMPYVNRRWLGGLLTNFQTMRQPVSKLVSLKSKLKKVCQKV